MYDHLYLADLADMTEDEIKTHIAADYAGDVSGLDYGSPTDAEQAALREELANFDILVAYESVGDWGCDSASYFLIRDRSSQKLLEVSGGHCSCYGFEGQWEPQEVEVEYLKSDKFYLGCGGYDDACDAHTSAVKAFLQTL